MTGTRILTAALMAALFALSAPAQSALVKGVVRDSSTGLPLAGVTVRVNGTTNSTVTDSLGRFALSIDTSATAAEIALPGSAAGAFVTCKIYDVRGRCLRTLSGDPGGVGNSVTAFERTLPNGLYLVRLMSATDQSVVKRLVIR